MDILTFSTAVDVAVARGAIVYPAASDDAIPPEARGAFLASPWRRATAERPYSLSPASLMTIAAGTRLVLPSPNGSAIVSSLPRGKRVLVGSLRNAAAVAAFARDAASVGVVAAGERWNTGEPRWALEDFLGAGAIISMLPARMRLSPEAGAARAAAQRLDVAAIRATASAVELARAGFASDVDLALELDVSEAVPLVTGAAIEAIA